jgi:hypothetical protein
VVLSHQTSRAQATRWQGIAKRQVAEAAHWPDRATVIFRIDTAAIVRLNKARVGPWINHLRAK